jgi:hypothetical protein
VVLDVEDIRGGQLWGLGQLQHLASNHEKLENKEDLQETQNHEEDSLIQNPKGNSHHQE